MSAVKFEASTCSYFARQIFPILLSVQEQGEKKKRMELDLQKKIDDADNQVTKGKG
jgi:hypothetical protein